MDRHTFETSNSKDFFDNMILEYEEYLEDDTSSRKAETIALSSWHIIEWILIEYGDVLGFSDVGKYRESLYPKCIGLKTMHDIANSLKHGKLVRPKASIKESRYKGGSFSSAFSNSFDISRLEIEYENGTTVLFTVEIQKVIEFWKSYFENDLGL